MPNMKHGSVPTSTPPATVNWYATTHATMTAQNARRCTTHNQRMIGKRRYHRNSTDKVQNDGFVKSVWSKNASWLSACATDGIEIDVGPMSTPEAIRT